MTGRSPFSQSHLRTVLACVEMKGEWLWSLQEAQDPSQMAEGDPVGSNLPYIIYICLIYIYQCYRDMVSRYEVSMLLKRAHDVGDKTLYVSPVIESIAGDT